MPYISKGTHVVPVINEKVARATQTLRENSTNVRGFNLINAPNIQDLTKCSMKNIWINSYEPDHPRFSKYVKYCVAPSNRCSESHTKFSIQFHKSINK